MGRKTKAAFLLGVIMKKLKAKIKKCSERSKAIDNGLCEIAELVKKLSQSLSIEFFESNLSKRPFYKPIYDARNFLDELQPIRKELQDFIDLAESLTSSGYKKWPYKKIDDHGYVTLYSPDLNNTRQEHRHVMDLHIGRDVQRDEVVHHINGIKTDNRPENLQVMYPHEHSKIHGELRRGTKKTAKSSNK